MASRSALMGRGRMIGIGAGFREPQLGPPAQLLGAEGGDVDEQEPALDRLRRLARILDRRAAAPSPCWISGQT